MSENPPKTPETGPFTIGPDLANQPIDGVVRTLFGLSWGRARDLVKRGKIAIDDVTVTVGTKHVRAGSVVTMNLAARDPMRARSELPKDAIVYLDADVVVVEKPPGISTVPFDPEGMGASIAKRSTQGKGKDEVVTLVERVKAALRARERSKSGPPPDLGVVHRLDKETSGLLVFTRTWAAKKALMQAFRSHTVHRRYFAVVHGVLAKDALTIESHFIENRGDGLRGSVEKRRGRNHAIGSEQTQRAVTHVEVIERVSTKATLIACRLETGRTHQIRIHLAEAGHPMVGERVYIRDFDSASLIASPRIMLHAAELGFAHPRLEKEMKWTSAMPADMTELLSRVRSEGSLR